MSDKQLPLVCWQKDGSLLILHVPTRESALLNASDSAADVLELCAADMEASAAILRRHNAPAADVLQRQVENARDAAKRLRDAVEKATA